LHVCTFWHDLSMSWILTFLLLLLTWKLQACVSWVCGHSFNTLEHGSLRMVRVAFFFHFFHWIQNRRKEVPGGMAENSGACQGTCSNV
jgi:hypothetical protein